MPALFILGIIVQVVCCIHVIKTGRSQTWIWFIIIAPGIGSLVYFIMELLPSLAGSNTAHVVKKSAIKALNPKREYRQAKDDLDYLDTIENRLRFAAAAVGTGHYDEAITAYEKCLTGQHATDPNIRLKLATAHFTSGNMVETVNQLDLLQQQNNGYQSQEGHLIYAQALEKLGRYEEARDCYDGLIAYALGEEARARYAMLLLNMGEHEKTAALFAEVIQNVDRSPKHYQKAQSEWYRIAKLNS